MQTIDYAPVQQALTRLKALSADAETRQQAETRARALYEEAMAMSKAEEIGEAKGEIKGKTQTLTRLLTKRFGPPPPEITLRLQTATLEQLELWTDRILDAPTLADVFRS